MPQAAKCERLVARAPDWACLGRGWIPGRVWLAIEGGMKEKEDDTALAIVVLRIRHSPVRGKETA